MLRSCAPTRAALHREGRCRSHRSVACRAAVAEAAASADTLVVCIGKTCRQEGSQATLDLMRELVPASLRVGNATCLSRCGGGPHVALRPRRVRCAFVPTLSRLLTRGCARSGEEADAVVGVDGCAAVLRRCCPDDSGLEVRLEAARLRTDGDAAAASGQYARAVELLSAALALRADLLPARLARASSLLALADHDAALADAAAVAAVVAAPTKMRARAHVVAARVHLVRGDGPAAAQACSAAVAADASIARDKLYVAAAQEAAKLASAA